jgi:hypothetical protein
MFMFGITTFMLALGIIALVLVTVYNFQLMEAALVDSSDGTSEFYILTAWGTITRLMVRLNDAFCLLHSIINGCSVHSLRYYLRLAHSGSVEQRQAGCRHSSVLHPWVHRYTEGNS